MPHERPAGDDSGSTAKPRVTFGGMTHGSKNTHTLKLILAGLILRDCKLEIRCARMVRMEDRVIGETECQLRPLEYRMPSSGRYIDEIMARWRVMHHKASVPENVRDYFRRYYDFH